ncbi:7416_t:CDS:2 [Dentiscutata heterogama]|uniref:7416_t:CDS:1 n=1 Tax=Dentiscutata heterogama TaxID=1316150 RepID=A0ACA9LQN1_9GLOM|nr:7416_t:CDS:2 [Dentiscutata heterogama]
MLVKVELYTKFSLSVIMDIVQHRNRKNESPEKHQKRISSEQNRMLRQIATETAEEREARLARDRE